jgi:hypothetical protein
MQFKKLSYYDHTSGNIHVSQDHCPWTENTGAWLIPVTFVTETPLIPATLLPAADNKTEYGNYRERCNWAGHQSSFAKEEDCNAINSEAGAILYLPIIGLQTALRGLGSYITS